MPTSLMDMEEDGSSNCCGAKVYMGICADCKEHCEAVADDDDDDPYFDNVVKPQLHLLDNEQD